MTQESGTNPMIELFLLGGVALRGVESPAADRVLAQPKITALLSFLALSPEQRPQRRDRIVALLWPDLDQLHARAALRKAVHVLRSALGPEAIRGRGDEEIGLAVPPLWCDAVELASAAASGRMLQAVTLYRGELLPGFHLADCADFDRWLDEQREAARERAAAAAWGLARVLEGDNKYTDAGHWAKKAVHYRWDDERVLRRTLSMLARIGDYAGALRLYEEFAERMQKDLEALPAPETIALADSLRPSARPE